MTINRKVEEHIYKLFSIFKIFFCIYLEVHCQGCQNNPLSIDPFSYYNYITVTIAIATSIITITVIIIIILSNIIIIILSSLLLVSLIHYHYYYH
jgi:hypothetical protein